MTSITATVSRGPAAPVIVEALQGEPDPDEMLVQIAATGLCHTDIGVLDTTMPVSWSAVPGHGAAGVVERVGSHITGLYTTIT